MNERPILFNTSMVRAILAGRKSQTRRPLSHLTSLVDGAGCSWGFWNGFDFSRAFADAGPSPAGNPGPYLHVPRSMGDGDEAVHRVYPRWQVGDLVWVRETWRTWNESCRETSLDEGHVCNEHCDQTYVAYAATPREGYRPKPDKAAITYLHPSTPLERNPELLGPWRPSIHMPKWASRITLRVTNVRVERVSDITDADAIAEGIESDDPRGAFAQLWESVYGKTAPWASSPWVWAVNFERVAA